MGGENFGEFGNLLRILQSFIRQLLVISKKKQGLDLNLPKISPTKIFCYTVCALSKFLEGKVVQGPLVMEYYILGIAIDCVNTIYNVIKTMHLPLLEGKNHTHSLLRSNFKVLV